MDKKTSLKAYVAASFILLMAWCGYAQAIDFPPFGEDAFFYFLNNDIYGSPDLDVWRVKCKQNNSAITASVWDASEVPGEPADNALHVSAVCIAPNAQIGKGRLKYSDSDYGVSSPQVWIYDCQEALVMVQCELNDNCDHPYGVYMWCNGSTADIAAGFPKKTQ